MHSLKNSGFFLDLSMGVRNLKKVFNFHQKRDHHPPWVKDWWVARNYATFSVPQPRPRRSGLAAASAAEAPEVGRCGPTACKAPKKTCSTCCGKREREREIFPGKKQNVNVDLCWFMYHAVDESVKKAQVSQRWTESVGWCSMVADVSKTACKIALAPFLSSSTSS